MSAVFSDCRTWRYTLTRNIVDRELKPLADGDDPCPSCGSLDYMCADPSLCLREREPRSVLFVCLNPSKADETKNDSTVTRMIGFAKAWGFERLVVCNIFAFCSTDPRALKEAGDPIGPLNSHYITTRARLADMVVVAWGNHGRLRDRGDYVKNLLYESAREKVHVLALNKGGEPKHPLYVRTDTLPVRLWP